MKKKQFALIMKSQNNIKTGKVHVCSVQKGNYNWKNLNCNWYTKLIEFCTNIVQTGFMRSMQSVFLPSLMKFQKLNRAVLTFGGMLLSSLLVKSSCQHFSFMNIACSHNCPSCYWRIKILQLNFLLSWFWVVSVSCSDQWPR